MAEGKLADFGLLKWNAPIVTTRRLGDCEVGEPLGRGDLTKTLNWIIRPREWEQYGKIYTQYVSSSPSSPSDVKKLAEKCEKALAESSAKESGICDTRWAIHQELFNELIREELINCIESGKLLVQIRDEGRMTVEQYRKLYESAAAYSMKKILEAEEYHKKLLGEKELLEDEIVELEKKYTDLLSKFEGNKVVHAELKAGLELKHLRELEYLTQINEEVKEQLRTLVPPKKAEEAKGKK